MMATVLNTAMDAAGTCGPRAVESARGAGRWCASG